MTKVSERVVDAAGRAAVLSPRDGVVLETVENLSDDGALTSFRQAEGPLAFYRRTVQIKALEDGRYRVRQVVELKVGLPWWSWLLVLPLRFWLGSAAARRPGKETVPVVGAAATAGQAPRGSDGDLGGTCERPGVPGCPAP